MATEHPAGSRQVSAVADLVADDGFVSRAIRHGFRESRGTRPFVRGQKPGGSKIVAIDVNCLNGVDAEVLPVQHFDGAPA